MSDHEKECRDCGIYFRNLQDLRDWRLIQTGICENCHKKEEREYMESKQRNNETKNQSITTGDVWKHKIEVDYYVRVSMVTNGEVFYVTEDGGEKRVDDADQFLTFYSLHKSAEPTIAVDSVWRHKEDGELVYIEYDDGDLHWNLNFSPLGETDMYADDTENFLSQYEFVCDSKYDSSLAFNAPPDMSVAIGDIWQARCEGFKCKVMNIQVNDGVTWVTTQSIDDEDEVESDKLRDFFEGYRFVGKGGVNQDTTSEKGTSLLGVKHSHYHKDVSKYKTMDIYAICKVWNAEPSGCTHHALKKLLHAGERGAKSKITDLEQAIESIEALIKLEKMDIRGDL